MKIALLRHNFFELQGGGERMFSVLANMLNSRSQNEVILIQKSLPSHNHSFFNLSRDIKVINLALSSKGFFSGWFFCFFRLLWFLKKGNVDYLIVEPDIDKPIYFFLAAKLIGIPTICWQHYCAIPFLDVAFVNKVIQSCQHLPQEVKIQAIKQYYTIRKEALYGYPIIARYAQKIITLTQKDKSQLQLFFSYKKTKEAIEHIPNVLGQLPKIHKNCRKKIVLACGRIEPQKGFDMLIRIWDHLMKTPRNHDWHLWIVGTHQFGWKNYEQYVKKISDPIPNILWKQPSKNISSYYQQASIFALSSRFESFGLVLAEAQAEGLPTIAFNTSGPHEIIKHQQTGYLIDPFHLDEFSQSLQKLMDDATLRLQFSKNAIINAQSFLPRTIMPLWNKLLNPLQ